MRIETGEYMKIRHILKITYMEINQHLFNFIITTFMLGVSFGLLFISFTVLGQYGYKLIKNQSVLSVPASQLYVINLDYYKWFSLDTAKDMYEFIYSLNDKEQGICAGLSFPGALNEDIDVYCISKELLPVGKLTDTQGTAAVLEEGERVIVGYELGKRYPIGSRIVDENSGNVYNVTQVLRRGSEWLPPNAAKGGIEEAVRLDNCLIMDADAYVRTNGYLSILATSDTVYCYQPELGEEEINAYIDQKAEVYGMRVYHTISLQKAAWESLLEIPQAYSVDIGLITIMTIISVIAIFISILISNDYKKQMFGILLSCGWTGRDIRVMTLLECASRVVLALLGAILGSYFYITYAYGAENEVIHQAYFILLPVLILVAAGFLILCNSWSVHRLAIQKPKDLIGGMYKE